MLTARAEPEQRIEDVEIEVEDYVAKAVRAARALCGFRISCAAAMERRLRLQRRSADGCFVFHIGRGELKRGRQTVRLTERERDLCANLRKGMARQFRVTSFPTTIPAGSERSIDVQINRLRRKIENDPSNPVYLQTVRGKGYILYTD